MASFFANMQFKEITYINNVKHHFYIKKLTRREAAAEDYGDYGDYDPNDKYESVIFDYLDEDTENNTDNDGEDVIASLICISTSNSFDSLCLGTLNLEFSKSVPTIKYVS